jgi:hypothetical protein
MTINYTTLLALGQPVTGTESGVWGDVVNNSVTTYLDAAIAGTLSLTTDANVTLTATQGTSSASNLGTTSAQYKIISCSGSRSTIRSVTVPTSSREYVVLNNTTGGFGVTIKGAATTGVTVTNGEYAVVAWNASTGDFVKLGSSAGAAAGGSNTQVQYNNSGVLAGSANMTFNGTTLTAAGFSGPLNGTVGATTASSGAFTTLTASSQVTLSPASNTVTISPTGTGTVAISPAGTLTLNPTTASTINNMSIGQSTAAAGSFTTLSASSTVSGTGFSTYLASPPAIGGTAAAAVTTTALTSTGAITHNTTTNNQSYTTTGAGTITISSGTAGTINNMSIGATTTSTGAFTTLTTSSTITDNGGTAAGVTYLNGSKQVTSGTALTFTGTNLGVGVATALQLLHLSSASSPNIQLTFQGTGAAQIGVIAGNALRFGLDTSNGATEVARFTSSNQLLVNTTTAISGINLNVSGGINSTNGALNVAGNGGFYNAANKFGVDNNAGASRLYSSGANSSTRGSYEFHITDSVGTLDTIAFQFGSAGQFGIGGATYGTSGNVLVSGGASAAPSWTGTPTFTTVSDSLGNVRTIVQNAQTSAYILVVGDAGKHISITTGGVTVNASIFSAGQAITIFNNSAANQTITQGTSVTMYLAGSATTGNRTLAQRGVATILCITGGATPVFVISGGGLT